LQNIKWAFTTVHCSYWHPATWLSLMLDCTLFGAKAGPIHLVNVAFHIANTLLLFIVFARMTKRIWPSAFVAALFALHPLNVESVAWVAERKNVLSTFFWLLTMLAYVRYVEKPSTGRYVTALISFALGLMSKPMLVTLPFVLMLTDYWPLIRFLNSKFSILNSIIEKLPFIFLSAILCVITFFAQRYIGAMAAMPFKVRIANAFCSYLEYIGKLFVPSNLAVLYPHPLAQIPLTKVIISVLVLLLLSGFLFYYGRQFKYLTFGWLWYLGTLVPVIGIVQVGNQAMADRYTYVPLIGLFVIIAFSAADLTSRIPYRNIALTSLACFILVACGFVASVQLSNWKNTFSLFEHTLAVTKNNYIIQDLYACLLTRYGRYNQAVENFREAIKLVPDAAYIHSNFGNTLLQLNRIDEAEAEFKLALKLDPKTALAQYNLAAALAKKGDYDGAITHYKIFLDMPIDKRSSVQALSDLGYVLAMKGDASQAIKQYYQALQLDPNDGLTHARLAFALTDLGRIDDAISQFRINLKLNPDDAEIQNALGLLLQSQGKNAEAVECFKKALLIDPNFTEAANNLNALLQKQIRPGR
jgi:Tfp pilus assembly protein PilF